MRIQIYCDTHPGSLRMVEEQSSTDTRDSTSANQSLLAATLVSTSANLRRGEGRGRRYGTMAADVNTVIN